MPRIRTFYISDVAITVFKLRSKSVNCLANRGSTGKYCLCDTANETQEHAVNCPEVADGGDLLNLGMIYRTAPVDNPTVRDIVKRLMLFEERFKELVSMSVGFILSDSVIFMPLSNVFLVHIYYYRFCAGIEVYTSSINKDIYYYYYYSHRFVSK